MSNIINNRILVRAMDYPYLKRNDGRIVNDFSTWATEYESACTQGLYSLSTTLLVQGETIPTYKPIGFIIDESKSAIRHISEQDSGSNGNELNNDFKANASDIDSLNELENIIKQKHENVMNEVNINIHDDAIVGLFANMSLSNRNAAIILLAQKYFFMQTGKELPIYVYNYKEGFLSPLNMSQEEKIQFIEQCIENKIIMSSDIFYETEKGEIKAEKYFDEIEDDNAFGPKL